MEPNTVTVVSLVSAAAAKTCVEGFLGLKLNWKPHDEKAKGVSAIVPIETKYYVARLRFVIVSESEVAGDKKAVLSSNGALIAIFCPSNGESWKRLSQWQDAILDTSPSVSICLGMGRGITEQQRREYVDWALDCQTEFIEEFEERPPDADVREVFGLARVLDSLRNNMWESMVMKQSGDDISAVLNAPNDIVDEAAAQSGPLPPADMPSDSRRSEYEPIGEDVSIKSGPSEDPGVSEEPPNASKVQQTKEPSSYPNTGAMLNMMAPLFEMLKKGEDMDGDDVFSLEKAISEMQALKTHAQTLPDDQRREFAARVALHFAELLDPDGDDGPLTREELELEAQKAEKK